MNYINYFKNSLGLYLFKKKSFEALNKEKNLFYGIITFFFFGIISTLINLNKNEYILSFIEYVYYIGINIFVTAIFLVVSLYFFNFILKLFDDNISFIKSLNISMSILVLPFIFGFFFSFFSNELIYDIFSNIYGVILPYIIGSIFLGVIFWFFLVSIFSFSSLYDISKMHSFYAHLIFLFLVLLVIIILTFLFSVPIIEMSTGFSFES